jgi:predicted HAD superfamily Cof-like phosphohydrolase
MTTTRYFNSDPYAGPVYRFLAATDAKLCENLGKDTLTEDIDNTLILLSDALDDLFAAINYRDDVQTATELAHLLVIVFATAIKFRIPLDTVFAAVVQSNQSRINPDTNKPYEVDSIGRVLRGPNFLPAEPAIKEVMQASLI